MTALQKLASREADQEMSMEDLVHYGSEVQVSDRANSWPWLLQSNWRPGQNGDCGKAEEFLLRISISASPWEIILIPVVLRMQLEILSSLFSSCLYSNSFEFKGSCCSVTVWLCGKLVVSVCRGRLYELCRVDPQCRHKGTWNKTWISTKCEPFYKADKKGTKTRGSCTLGRN